MRLVTRFTRCRLRPLGGCLKNASRWLREAELVVLRLWVFDCVDE